MPWPPVLLVGFRPFFLIAFVLGTFLPLAWALLYTGAISMPQGSMLPLHWHAHEMLFGFGWSVLGGFLLTASKNWVGIRGMHGGPLALAVLLFLVERVAVVFLGSTPREPLAFVLLNAFGLYVIAYLVGTLVRYREQDTFSDNWIFVVALPLFLAAKNLMLDPTHRAIGTAMAIGLFRVAFAVMFERTITQFMKNAMNVELPRSRLLDYAIKGLVLVSVFEAVLPAELAALSLGLASLLLFARWLAWKPMVAFRNFGIGVMYVGYLGLVVHLLLQALVHGGVRVGEGTLATHVFTFVCMGTIIPSMLIRIAQGHTGRKPVFTRSDQLALALMGVGAVFRLVATQAWPMNYVLFVQLSAICWSSCFALVGWRLSPFLWRVRIDGKEH